MKIVLTRMKAKSTAMLKKSKNYQKGGEETSKKKRRTFNMNNKQAFRKE